MNSNTNYPKYPKSHSRQLTITQAINWYICFIKMSVPNTNTDSTHPDSSATAAESDPSGRGSGRCDGVRGGEPVRGQ